jgi:hypothetical protein
MTVSAELVGAWRRSGLIIDGRRHVDYCDVLWIQTPELFADIRLPIDPNSTRPTRGVPGRFAAEMAFAGTGSWEDPIMTWSHELDSALETAVDANPLSAEDGVMVERGQLTEDGRQVPFIEEWLRLTGQNPEWEVASDPSRIRVQVGRWAIEVADLRPGGSFTARRYERGPSGWTETGSMTA